MEYKTNNKYFKDSLLFRCNCGEFGFLAVEKIEFSDNEPEFYLYFIESPYGFMNRLKWLFKKDKDIRDIILSKSDIISLGEWIKCKTE